MMLKRLISFVVSITIIVSLGAVMTVHATEDYSLLSALGVSIDTENLDKPITRIELAELAIKLTKSSLITEGKAVFADVPQKHKYFSIVNTVYINGLMNGYSDGTFKPNESAVKTDAGAMILNLLGYGYLMESADIPDVEKQNIANNIGIYDGVPSGPLTNKGLGKMLLNMLDAYVVKPSGGGVNINYEPSNETYLEQLTGYVPKEGIVQAVGAASVFGADTVDYGWCMIDGVRYKSESVDMLQYLGLAVKVVLDEENGSIVSVKTKKKTDEKIIEAEDITEYQNFTYAYTENEGRSIKTIKVPSDARIVLNGKNMTYDANLMIPQDGSVRFVNIDSDSEYDLVIITSQLYIKVGTYIEDDILSDAFGNAKIDLDITELICYQDGVKVGNDALAKGKFVRIVPDVLTYSVVGDSIALKPDEFSCKYVRCDIIPENKIEGKVTVLSEKTITVESTELSFSGYLDNLMGANVVKKPTISSVGAFYINENNKIIGFELTSRFSRDSSVRYGYLLNCFQDDAGDRVMISIVNEEAEKETLTTSEKFRVNNERKTYKQLKNDNSISNEKIFVNGVIKKQLIGYELNDKQEITKLYIAKDYAHQYILDENQDDTEMLNPNYQVSGYYGYDDENFSLDYSSGKKTASAGQRGMRHLYSFDDSTIVFEIPKDSSNYSRYKVLLDRTKLDDTSSYIKLYNVKENYAVGAVLIDNSLAVGGSSTRNASLETYGGNSQACMVTGEMLVYDTIQDEIVTLMEGKEFTYSTSGLTGVMKDVDLKCSDPEFEDTDTRINGAGELKPFGTLKWQDLELGDIILKRVDEYGEITRFSVLFRYGELYNADGSVNYRDINPKLNTTATIKLTVSRVVNVLDDGTIVFTPSATDDFTKFMKGTCANICLVDGGVKYTSVIDSSELRIGDTIFTRSEKGVLKEVFVFR